jgi:hypothetical protein
MRGPTRAGEVPGLFSGGEGLVILVEAAWRDGLIDLQQQVQIGQGRTATDLSPPMDQPAT